MHDSRKRIYAVTSNNRCHVVSEDGLIWSCTSRDEWIKDSSSRDFIQAIVVPNRLKRGGVPQNQYIASTQNGKVTYGGEKSPVLVKTIRDAKRPKIHDNKRNNFFLFLEEIQNGETR